MTSRLLLPMMIMAVVTTVAYQVSAGTSQRADQRSSTQPRDPITDVEQLDSANTGADLQEAIVDAIRGGYVETDFGVVLAEVVRVDASASNVIEYQIGIMNDGTPVFLPVRGDRERFDEALRGLDGRLDANGGFDLIECTEPEERICVLTCGEGSTEYCCRWECQ